MAKKETIVGKVHSVSGPRVFNGLNQIGFTLDKSPKEWYNIKEDQAEDLEALKTTILMKGAEIEFEFENQLISNLKLTRAPVKQEKNWSDDITNFKDLLAKAHEEFGEKMHIRTEVLKDGQGNPLIDLEKKTALFKAQVYIRRDDKNTQVFEGHGDATTENITNRNIQPHFIRMAETRAICRALKLATNNATVSEEEIGK